MPPDVPLFAERLTPSVWVWVSAVLVAASSGLVVLTTLGQAAAIVVAITAAAFTGWALGRTSAVIELSSSQLRAGRARIPLAALGSVREVDEAQMQALRGPQADARAYLCQRGWIPAGVAVAIEDPGDHVPYWLLSSRRPAQLAAALRTAIAAAEQPPPPAQAHSRQTS